MLPKASASNQTDNGKDCVPERYHDAPEILPSSQVGVLLSQMPVDRHMIVSEPTIA